MNETMSVMEAAELLGCHVRTIRRWLADGTIPDLRPPGDRTSPVLLRRADVVARLPRGVQLGMRTRGHLPVTGLPIGIDAMPTDTTSGLLANEATLPANGDAPVFAMPTLPTLRPSPLTLIERALALAECQWEELRIELHRERAEVDRWRAELEQRQGNPAILREDSERERQLAELTQELETERSARIAAEQVLEVQRSAATHLALLLDEAKAEAEQRATQQAAIVESQPAPTPMGSAIVTHDTLPTPILPSHQPTELNREQRRELAIQLRAEGKSWDEVGTALGCHRSSARRLVASVRS